MKTILEATKEFLDAENFHHHQPQGESFLVAGAAGRNGKFQVIFDADEEHIRSLKVISLCPVTAPPERRSAVAELIQRITRGLTTGCLSMDVVDGDIRFRTNVIFGDCEPAAEIIEHVVFSNLIGMDHYLPLIAAVALGGISVEAAMSMPKKSKGVSDQPLALGDTKSSTIFPRRLVRGRDLGQTEFNN
jgi:hypothetical protein